MQPKGNPLLEAIEKPKPSPPKPSQSHDTRLEAPLTSQNGSTSSQSVSSTSPKKPNRRNNGKQKKNTVNVPKPPNQVQFEMKRLQEMQSELNAALINPGNAGIIEILERALRPNPQHLHNSCKEVQRDLTTAFNRYYSEVRVEVFGSTIMGMAIRDSDLDFYVSLSIRGARCSAAEVVRDAAQMLRQSKMFGKFCPIPHARVPILKCQHLRTGYFCDLNFSDSLGVFNSPIMSHLLQFDRRIYELAIVVKFWMKVHALSGSSKVSNYAGLWLIIFYLQNIDEPIVPPISEFQKNIEPMWVGSSNLAFNRQMPNQTKNIIKTPELLLGFFEFYQKFEFETKVICPLHAKAFDKEKLLENNPQEFARCIKIMEDNPEIELKMKKSLCIQDPFDLCHIIPGLIPLKHFDAFRLCLRWSAEVVRVSLYQFGESCHLLQDLFNGVIFQAVLQVEKNNERIAKNARRNNEPVTEEQSQRMSKVTLNYKLSPNDADLTLVRNMLSQNVGLTDVIELISVKKCWAEHIVKFIVHFLEHLFQLTVTDVSNRSKLNFETLKKLQKLEGQSDVYTSKYLRVLNVTGTHDVFYSRRMNRQKRQSKNFIEEEIKISKARCAKGGAKVKFNASVTITTDLEQFDSVEVKFEDIWKKKKGNFFKGFYSSFTQIFPNYKKPYFTDAILKAKETENNGSENTSGTISMDGMKSDIIWPRLSSATSSKASDKPGIAWPNLNPTMSCTDEEKSDIACSSVNGGDEPELPEEADRITASVEQTRL